MDIHCSGSKFCLFTGNNKIVMLTKERLSLIKKSLKPDLSPTKILIQLYSLGKSNPLTKRRVPQKKKIRKSQRLRAKKFLHNDHQD